MRRRDILSLLGGAVVSWPIAGRAQQRTLPVVGFLGAGTAGPLRGRLASFDRGLKGPALIVSPFAKKGYVDHTQYDTTSILRFITRRFGLPILPGLAARDRALKANGHPAMGDLSGALRF
jgi:hypothetical protein